MSKRVVVTGLGTINPLSDNVKDFWENLISLKNPQIGFGALKKREHYWNIIRNTS